MGGAAAPADGTEPIAARGVCSPLGWLTVGVGLPPRVTRRDATGGLRDRVIGTGHPNRRVLLLAVAAVLLALTPAVLRAQTPTPPRLPEAVTLSGEVRDLNPLTVRVDGQDRRLQTTPDVLVVREGKTVPLDALNVGDRVSVTTTADTLVQQVTVTQAASDSMNRWLLLGLAVLLLAAAAVLLWYLSWRRRDRDARSRTGTPRR